MEKNTLCAAVLAGGFGTRLSPLTDSVPKPLLKILDCTVLELTVKKLEKTGAYPVTVSAFYKREDVTEHVKQYRNVRVICENEPMGTAGGAKLCMNEGSENMLVLSGDGIFDFDLERIIEYHFNSQADVTIVSTHCDNPTRFGVVVGDKEGNVVDILEKPSWKHVVTNVVNTGIYVLSKKAVEQIPSGIPCDFSKDLFPRLIKSGYKVKTVTLDGYWCDMGTPYEYLKCNLDACFGKIKTLPNLRNEADSLNRVGIHAKSHVFLGENAVIGCNVVMENGLVAGKNCAVGENVRLSKSVLGESVKIGDGCSIYGALIGDGACVGENCIIGEGCIIEQGSVIPEGTVLEKNISVCRNGKMYENSGCEKESVLFCEDGTAVFSHDTAAEDIRKFGCSLSRALLEENGKSASAGVICTCEDEKILQSFVEGCIEAGAGLYILPDANRSHACFASIYYPCDVVVCICDFVNGIKAEIYEWGKTGISDKLERKTVKLFAAYDRVKNEKCERKGKAVEIYGTGEIYTLALSKAISYMLGNCPALSCFSLEIDADSKNESALVRAIKPFYENKNGTNKKSVKIFMKDELRISDSTTSADVPHILAAVLSNLRYIGINKAYIHEDSPEIFGYILKKSGTDFSVISDEDTQKPFENMLSLLILWDKSFCVAALLCIMEVRGMGLGEILREIPVFEIYSDVYYGHKSRAATMEKLCRLYEIGTGRGSGVTVKLSEGNVTVIPDRVRGFKVISEAVKTETAKELCMRIANAINNSDGEKE